MRIGIFIDDYLPSVHGVATSTTNLKEALEGLGHEVYVIAPRCKGYRDEDDHVIRVPSSKNYVFDKRETGVIYPGLARRLDKYEFDIVHSQMQFYVGVLAHSVAKRQNIPHVTTVHTLYTELIDDYPLMVTAGIIALTVALPIVLRTRPILPTASREQLRSMSREAIKETFSHQGWRLTAAFANKCEACISPSNHLARILIDEGGLTAPCYVRPNGINTRQYRDADPEDSPIEKSPGEKFIISVARLSPEKRQKALIEAIPFIPDTSIKLVLVGGGPYEHELRTRAEELRVTDRVIFTGMQPSDKVAALLKQADVFSLASYHFDNQPMTFLEAASSGLPIVYCDEQMTEGLTKRNAVLTGGIEGEDLAQAFNDLFSNPEKLDMLSRGSLDVAQEFDSTTMAARMADLYEKLIRDHRTLSRH
ncbi:glycosyltransferase [Actinomyces israelii]|uniref:Glycosyltransferase n=1 Tax=Actinomyces israelii TaxID=1659 RepID=A0ABT4I8M4_9ACTO|nr:glycosyltransferase [Actinomyces israelii]MCZ0858085.1 glycosyltransferase [Actinomyces israelii]WKR20505.1 Alpha-monoglucosyldiacylglycerol synthase [Actinomyces israelii]